jgi:uncharacterized protein (UPF0332 family)
MDPEQFDWADLYKLADELSKREDYASLRTAMGRAYYYVYHLALDRARLNGFTTISGEGTHTQLWRNYSASPDPSCSGLAIIATRLKEKRERADYNDYYKRLKDDIPEMLADASDFAAKLKALPARFPDPSHRA